MCIYISAELFVGPYCTSITVFFRWKLLSEIISLRPQNTIIVDTHIFHVFLWDPLIIFRFWKRPILLKEEKTPENKKIHSNSFHTYGINVIYIYTVHMIHIDDYIVITMKFQDIPQQTQIPESSPPNHRNPKSQLLHWRLLDLAKESKDSKKIRSPWMRACSMPGKSDPVAIFSQVVNFMVIFIPWNRIRKQIQVSK